jgi:hypothetical protein
MHEHEQELGPIDIVVIAYPADAPMTGEAVPLFMDLINRGIIRVLDVMIVYEKRWAGPFVAAVRRNGGVLVASERIPAQDLLEALDAAEAAA